MTSAPALLLFPGWTEDELDEVLYHWDKSTSPVIEYKHKVSRPLSIDNTTSNANENANVLPPTISPTKNSPNDKTENTNNNTTSTDNEEEELVAKVTKPEYLDISIEGDDVHIFKFYAYWCPHCQHFKPTYVQIAKEVVKRSINVNVFFHAVSCTLNEAICETYKIEGYPIILGYRGGGEGGAGGKGKQNDGETKKVTDATTDDNDRNDDDKLFPALVGDIKIRGAELELDAELNRDIDIIAATMKFDLISLPRDYSGSESKYSNSEDQRRYESKKLERSHEVAKETIELLEYSSEASKNEIYHDAALSLTYLLRTGIYYKQSSSTTSTAVLEGYNDISALEDFLRLVYWSTPSPWLIRKRLIKDLIQNFDSVVIQGKSQLVDLVERYSPVQNDNNGQNHHHDLLWGYIDAKDLQQRRPLSKRRHATNNHNDHGNGNHSNNNIEVQHVHADQKKWTKACAHGPTSRGFTCGLWELFHIVTIGSGMIENQVYGFQHGYRISQRDVAETIRNFIGRFFRCDVCRTNFITMYDNCGYDHCTRLSNELPFISNSKTGDDHDQSEVAMWLWEVHNAVNLRLLKEKAQRERRTFTKEEELASKFPTKNTCPLCWLDDDMNEWDSVEVYKFLKGHYWPGGGGDDNKSHKKNSWNMNSTSMKNTHGDMSIQGQPLTTSGLFFVSAPFLIVLMLFLKRHLCSTKFSLPIILRPSKNKFF